MPYVTKLVWPRIRRAHEKVPLPYGYMPYFKNPKLCVIDPKKVEALETALFHIDHGESFKSAATYLTQTLGESITAQGISNIWWKMRGEDPNNDRAVELKRKKRLAAPKTPKDKAERAAKQRLSNAKRELTLATRKVDTFKPEDEGSIPVFLPDRQETLLESTLSDVVDGREVAFRPHAGPQEQFLAASEQEVLYGGAAGGGKSYGLLADPMRYFDNPNFNGIIFRRTNDELRELKWKANELYKKVFPGVVWREKDSTFVFPSGARLWFTYLEQDKDVLRYQGQAFTYIGFDELTQYPTPFALDYMRSRLRDASGTLPLFIRATTNPGGPGHGWVKRMFIDPAPAGKAFDALDIETGEVLKWPENDPMGRSGPLFQRRFIPAKLSDNPSLYRDGQYEANLLSLTENKRRQLLEGDWNIADGAAFSEWREKYHTCEPFVIPHNWRRFRSCDYGYNSFSAVHWFAIDPVYNTLVVYRELYVTKKTGYQLADLILQLEYNENVSYGVLDSSVWAIRGQTGPTIAEEMISRGVRWRPADRAPGSRVAGANRLHELLIIDHDIPHFDEGKVGRPGLVIFNTCRQIISDLPVIPADPKGSDDIDDTYASDHSYDSIRYGVMSRPRPNNYFDMRVVQHSSGYKPADSVVGY